MSNEQTIWNYFKDKGLRPAGIAGLMGNLYAESGLNPTNLQNSYEKKLGMTDSQYTTAVDNGTYTNFVKDSAGYGLAQWTYWSRKQALLAFCLSKGQSIGSLQAQLDFLYQELTSSYLQVWKILMNTNSVLEASNAVLLQFERPANQSSAIQNERASYGQVYYNKYAIQQEVNSDMSNSSLATYKRITNNKTTLSNKTLNRISIHCFVGQVTTQRGVDYFATTDRQASSNYVVGYDGSIGLSVDEKDRSWCTSSAENDKQAITIEVASETTDPYKVTDAAYNALLDLVTDICQRNGKTKVIWNSNKTQALAYKPASNEVILTVHRWFANKACPGEYLYSRHGEIAAEVTKRLGGGAIDQVTAVNYQVKVTANAGLNCRTVPVNGSIMATYEKGTILTISKEQSGWGYTGKGWVSLQYTEKLQQTSIEEEEDMTQEKFNEMMNVYIEQQANQDATFEQDALIWAQNNGLLVGDEKGRLMAKKFMTRGEFIVVLQRFYKKFGNQ